MGDFLGDNLSAISWESLWVTFTFEFTGELTNEFMG